jgi:AcrR family transcriptional regulator
MKYQSKKHQEIVTIARELFWKHGFKRVTIEEICQKANVSKMTFYRFYLNKMELAKAVFDMVIDKSIADFHELLNNDLPTSEKIRSMLLMKFEGTNDISKEFLMDFYSNPELEVSAYIQRRTTEVWAKIIEDFRKGQHEGWLRRDFKPEIILIMSRKLMELVSDDNVLKLYNSPQELIMEIANFFTFGIVNHDK